jgi:hypothetical protein
MHKGQRLGLDFSEFDHTVAAGPPLNMPLLTGQPFRVLTALSMEQLMEQPLIQQQVSPEGVQSGEHPEAAAAAESLQHSAHAAVVDLEDKAVSSIAGSGSSSSASKASSSSSNEQVAVGTAGSSKPAHASRLSQPASASSQPANMQQQQQQQQVPGVTPQQRHSLPDVPAGRTAAPGQASSGVSATSSRSVTPVPATSRSSTPQPVRPVVHAEHAAAAVDTARQLLCGVAAAEAALEKDGSQQVGHLLPVSSTVQQEEDEGGALLDASHSTSA